MGKALTARASAIDMMHSSSRSTGVIGPIAGLDAAVLADRFRRLAQIGPIARVGLAPTPEHSRWNYTADVADRVAVLPADIGPRHWLTGFRDPTVPARVGVAGSYFLFDYNHGIGDIALVSRFIEVVLCGVDPADPALWTGYRSKISPLLVATTRTYAASPARALKMVAWHSRTRRNASPVDSRPAPATSTPVGGPATATARIPAADLLRLRSWRDEHASGGLGSRTDGARAARSVRTVRDRHHRPRHPAVRCPRVSPSRPTDPRQLRGRTRHRLRT